MIQTRGFSLLECMLALGLVALISQMAVYSYHYLITKQSIAHDVTAIETALRTSRQLGLLEKHPVIVQFDVESVHIHSGVPHRIELSGRTHVHLAFFPKSRNSEITFTEEGHTVFQNGSIYVCPDKFAESLAQRIVINQAGRVRVTREGALEGC